MRKTVLRVGYDNESIVGLRANKHSLHEQFPLPKIPPKLFDEYVHTFLSEPGVGTTVLFSIEHELKRIPMAQIMINEIASGYSTPLTEYYLYLCSDFQVVPPFDFIEYQMYVKAEIDETALTVSLVKSVAGAYVTSPICTGFPLVNGTSFNFKYYIFLEGHTDDDVQNITISS